MTITGRYFGPSRSILPDDALNFVLVNGRNCPIMSINETVVTCSLLSPPTDTVNVTVTIGGTKLANLFTLGILFFPAIFDCESIVFATVCCRNTVCGASKMPGDNRWCHFYFFYHFFHFYNRSYFCQ